MRRKNFSLYSVVQPADASIPSLETDSPFEFAVVAANEVGGAAAPALAANIGTEWDDFGFDPEHVAYASENLPVNDATDTGFALATALFRGQVAIELSSRALSEESNGELALAAGFSQSRADGASSVVADAVSGAASFEVVPGSGSATVDSFLLPVVPQSVVPSAALARTPALTVSWAGVTQSQAGGWNPPDCNMAAGTSNIVTVVNNHIDIYDKTGASLYSQSLNTFFNAPGSNFVFDPRVMWDQFSGRFVVVADDQTGSNSHVYIAASVDSNPLNGWYKYDFNFKSGNSWLDYPVLGLDASSLYISGNYFDLTTGSYTFSGLWALDKSNLESGQAVTAWLYNPANLGAPYSDLYTPAHMYGTKAGLNGDFFVEYGQNNSGNDTLRIDRIENAATGTASFNIQSLNVGNITDAFPAGARQPGTSTLIDDGDWRIQNAVWRADKLYAVTEIRVGSGASAHDVVHWFVVDTSNLNTLTLLSQGNVDYGSDYDTYFGNLTVDGSGNMIIGYSFSGPGTPGDPNRAPAYASSVYAVIPAGGTGLADGGFYLMPGQGVNTGDRWGDYSGVAIDPADDKSFWVFNEHATSSNSWATTIGGFQVSQTPGSISINDVSVTEGNSGTKVMTFTVTRTGGTAAFAVNFATSDRGATVADSDYVANSGTLNFGTNVNTQTISVTIKGDTKSESDEAFSVNLSGATNGATISDSLGIGTILNDDQTMANFWVSEGPGPGINGQESVAPNNQINGAIQAIAVHPTDPNIMYVGSVNGGIWKTTNATAAAPHWVPLTDNLPSLSIGALEFDLTDATRQTLIAGIGATSSFGALHDPLNGVLRTTDGGATWSQLGAAALGGDNITSVAARGTTLLAAAESNWGFGAVNGLFRSTNSGASWTLISDGAHGLPNLASVSDLVGDPLNPNVLYAAVTGAGGGVFKSTDTGLTWTNITSGIGVGNTTDRILLAVHHDTTNLDVFATIDNGGILTGVFRSLNGGSFVALDVPSGGIQGEVHASIAAEPTNHNIVYVGFGGGNSNYLTRIDASRPSGSQITKISGGSFGSPHVDPRDMDIDANGNLILGTDGGLFRLPTPTANTGVWSAIVGDMSVFEIHDLAYDHVSNIIMAGTQDNGTLFQLTPGGATWDHPGFGDGGDVVIDDVSLAGSGRSIRYFSSQNLSGWTRQVYDSANHLVSTTSLASISDGQFSTPVELNNVDPTRLLVGGSGHIYTSSNQGTSLTSIADVGVNSFFGGGMMVYGGFQGAVVNPDLIYAASGANVVRQTAAGGGFTTTSPGGSTIRGVTDNPTNWASVFAIDDNQIFRSTNMGGTWVDVTANLTSLSAADFRSIEYVHGTADDALVVGTSSGVFYAKVSGLGGAASWSELGANLPDAIVYDFEYDAVDNVLVAGTMGRGAWLVNDATINLGIDSQPQPDLDALNLALGSTSVAVGGSTNVSYTVSNLGGSASGAFTVGIYRSADGVIDPSDTLLTTRSLGSIGAGASASDSFALTLSTAGTYNIIVIPDHNGLIMESNEVNNPSNAATVMVASGPGNDTLVGGPGNDVLDGRGGIDTVDYSSTSQGVVVNLSAASNQATGPEIGIDQLISIENVIGGNGNDRIVGNAVANRITGGPGADKLTGGPGGDIFVFDAAALADGQAGPVLDRVTDYGQGNGGAFSAAEGDQLDFSALVAAAFNHGAGQPAGALVRAIQDTLDGSSALQVDPDGAANGVHWTTVARLDGVGAGAHLNAVLDAGQPAGADIVVRAATFASQSVNFDDDARGDILWRNDDGTVALWQMNGAAIAGNSAVAQIANHWTIVGTGDFNGDSRSDVLWRQDGGLVAMWEMDGPAIVGNFSIAQIPTEWHVVGMGDFNGDHRSDVLWRHDNGLVALWEMDGPAIVGNFAIAQIPTEWHVVGTGDFNGDGRSDILWRQDGGLVALWEMDGPAIVGNFAIAQIPNDWRVVETGDFNHDHRSDILWRQDGGLVAMWEMDGPAIAVNAAVANIPYDWHIVGGGDFNGDGNTDIAWRATDGTVATWEMDGPAIVGNHAVAAIPNDWHLLV
ncbi:MAG TPA: FG-GAP-like repeat-containing protein [Beijerinckiaceae bacterium]|jgi:hypothetical protein